MATAIIRPIDTARRQFRPCTDVGDKRIERLGLARSVVGSATLVLTLLPFNRWQDAVLEPGNKMLTTLAVAAGVTVIASATIYRFTSTHGRQAMRPALKLVARRYLILGGRISAFVAPLAVYVFIFSQRPGPKLVIVGLALWLAAMVTLLPCLCALYWAARTFFGIGDLHPALPAICTGVTVAITTLLDFLTFDTKGLSVGFWIAMQAAGLVTTLLLAGWEIVSVRALTARSPWRSVRSQ